MGRPKNYILLSMHGDLRTWVSKCFNPFVSSGLLGSRTFKVGEFNFFSRNWACEVNLYMFVITLVLDLFRFPGKKTQDNNIESKSVTAAKRARKETTVDEILGESFIK